MHDLYIKLKGGVPINHPILRSNVAQAFPSVDLNNPGPDFAPFERVAKPRPDPGKYIVSATCSYQWAGDKVTDVWELVQADIPAEDAATEGS